jgi:hypothetical protein
VKEYVLNDPKVIEQIRNQVKNTNNMNNSNSNLNLNNLETFSKQNFNKNTIKEIKLCQKNKDELSSKFSKVNCKDIINSSIFFDHEFDSSLNKSKSKDTKNTFAEVKESQKFDLTKIKHDELNAAYEKEQSYYRSFILENNKDSTSYENKQHNLKSQKIEHTKGIVCKESSINQKEEIQFTSKKNLRENKDYQNTNKTQDSQHFEQPNNVRQINENMEINRGEEKKKTDSKIRNQEQDEQNFHKNLIKGIKLQEKGFLENKLKEINGEQNDAKYLHFKNLNDVNLYENSAKNVQITSKQQQLGIDLLSVFESYVREAKDQMND